MKYIIGIIIGILLYRWYTNRNSGYSAIAKQILAQWEEVKANEITIIPGDVYKQKALDTIDKMMSASLSHRGLLEELYVRGIPEKSLLYTYLITVIETIFSTGYGYSGFSINNIGFELLFIYNECIDKFVENGDLLADEAEENKIGFRHKVIDRKCQFRL